MYAHFAFSTDFALFTGYASSWYFFAKAFFYVVGITVSSFVHVAVSGVALFRPTVYRSSWCSAHRWSSCWCSPSSCAVALHRIKPRPHQSTTFFHCAACLLLRQPHLFCPTTFLLSLLGFLWGTVAKYSSTYPRCILWPLTQRIRSLSLYNLFLLSLINFF